MPEPLDRHQLLLDYDVISSGRPEDMKWSEWAAMRSHTRQGIQALLAEVDRLRLIAAPLERLEAWLHSGHDCRSRIFADEAGVNVELDDGRLHRQQGADAQAETLLAAITSALDAWERDYGKDGP